MATGLIERRPDNAPYEYVCVIKGDDGSEIQFAFHSRERAEHKLPKLVKAWTERGR